MTIWSRLFSRDDMEWRKARRIEGFRHARGIRATEIVRGLRYDTAKSDLLWAWWEYDAGYSDGIEALYRTPRGRYFTYCDWDNGNVLHPVSEQEAIAYLEQRDPQEARRIFGEAVDA